MLEIRQELPLGTSEVGDDVKGASVVLGMDSFLT